MVADDLLNCNSIQKSVSAILAKYGRNKAISVGKNFRKFCILLQVVGY